MVKASGMPLALLILSALPAAAQTSVVTQSYDTARAGANTNETILTPENCADTRWRGVRRGAVVS